MTKKFIIFDFDGTIADSMHLIVEIVEAVKTEFPVFRSLDLSPEDYRRLDYKQIFAATKIKPWQLPKLVKYINQQVGLRIDQVNPFPDIKLVLQKLQAKNIKLGILSSNLADNINAFLKTHQINGFEFIDAGASLFGKDVRLKKIIAKHHLTRPQLLYVGDEVRDVEACRQIGIDAAAVSWGKDSYDRLQAANPTFLITQPQDLLDLVE